LGQARTIIAIFLLAGLVGCFGYVGADGRWLAALGHQIVTRGAVPASVPFMAAASAHWANPLVLAEVVFHLLEGTFGDRGLAVAQTVCVAGALALLARDARAGGGRAPAIVGALTLAAVGAFPSLAIARVQMFSLVLFPLLVMLLRAEARLPSRRIWLAVPLLAVWSNLHGAVLLGVATLLAYLILSRLRQDPLTAIGVAVAGVLSLCLTPAGFGTISYLYGLSTNLAAQRGAGQWAPLGDSPFDVVAVLAVLVLVLKLLRARRRPELWELAVMVGLAALTVKAARDDVWLLFFLVGPASRRSLLRADLTRALPIAAAVAAVLVVVALVRPPGGVGASAALVQRALAIAHGGPILADGIPAEQVALAGGRVWAGNPVDALPRRAQAAYLDWVSGAAAGSSEMDQPAVHVVLVTRGSAAAQLVQADRRFALAERGARADLYVRR
jgi:hypothetical protein